VYFGSWLLKGETHDRLLGRIFCWINRWGSCRHLAGAEKLMYDAFTNYLQIYHRATPEDFEPTEVPGYWQTKKPCNVKTCREPLHSCLFNEGAVRHTVYFENCQRVNGRFAPKELRFKSWLEACKKKE
jgi:hypothetical protein